MEARQVYVTGFRNIGHLTLALPGEGAVFLGPNGQGKTNLLEAIYYPVLFRSLRSAKDTELIRHGETGFRVRLDLADPSGPRSIEATFLAAGRRKRVAVDGAESPRLTEALGIWLAVAFLPSDVALIAGGASERRQFLDRVLALSDPQYLRNLRQYRAAVDQRNAALRKGDAATALAFDPLVARFGAPVIEARLHWVDRCGPAWRATCAALGEPIDVGLAYRGRPDLVDPGAWPAALADARGRDLATGATSVGPHRDDLTLRLADTPLRVTGSSGQHRTAAIALKLVEWDTLRDAHGTPPALLLDDVFAELDRSRQDRLAERLLAAPGCQVLVTAPRPDELPAALHLPVFDVLRGEVTHRKAPRAA